VFLALVEQVPARWVCLTALVAVIAVALRRGLREARWASVAGTAAGGAAVAWFFFVKVDEGYIWGVELSSVLLMYVGFLGASMATRDNKHIQVDAVRRKMPLRWLHLYNMVGGLVTVGTCLLLCVLASEYVISQAGHGNTLEATQLPEVVVSLPIAVATGMMAIRFAVQTAGHLAAHLRGDEPSRPEAGAH
jgi:TRAP-type C4-dicarboxylate transport system permease small subunit